MPVLGHAQCRRHTSKPSPLNSPSSHWRASFQMLFEEPWRTPSYRCSGVGVSGCLERGCSEPKSSRWAAGLGQDCPWAQRSPAEGWASPFEALSPRLCSPAPAGHTAPAELPAGWLHGGFLPASPDWGGLSWASDPGEWGPLHLGHFDGRGLVGGVSPESPTPLHLLPLDWDRKQSRHHAHGRRLQGGLGKTPTAEPRTQVQILKPILAVRSKWWNSWFYEAFHAYWHWKLCRVKMPQIHLPFFLTPWNLIPAYHSPHPQQCHRALVTQPPRSPSAPNLAKWPIQTWGQ